MKRKKVLVVNNLLGYYGAENVLINMVNNMDQQKYEITVLTLNECDDSFLKDSVRYSYIFEKGKGIYGRIKNKLNLALGFERLAKKYCSGYDVAIAFKMGECANLVSRCDAPKKYCWIHSNVSQIDEPYSYSFNGLKEEKECLSKFDSLISVSAFCLESFVKKYGNEYQIKVIYNPIDSVRIAEMANEELPQEDTKLFNTSDPIIGTVARIDNQKRIDRLIYISQKLTEAHISHKLIIIGDGVDFQKYSAEIKDKKLSNIYMIGFRKNPYMYVKRFNLFICSSFCESYSIVVNEALALGVPVISTKCGGPEEVLQHGRYGILTENKKESLFETVKDFLLGNAIKPEIYDPENSMKNFQAEIEKLI